MVYDTDVRSVSTLSVFPEPVDVAADRRSYYKQRFSGKKEMTCNLLATMLRERQKGGTM